jgi:hypothetical protein
MSLPRADEWSDPGSMDPPPRRGRRVLIVVAFLAVGVVGSALIWRATSLRGLPDLGEPFDTRALGVIAVPENENAFTYYRRASAQLDGVPSTNRPFISWGEVPLADKDWFFANAAAIELWVDGTMQDRAVFIQPKDFRNDSPMKVAYDLRTFAALAEIAGLRLEAAGDLDQAWTWYRAGLRSSRHCGMHGGIIERLCGISIYNRLETAIRGWADQPNLTTDTLRQALAELIVINAMTPSLSENLRAEYFLDDAVLNDPNLSVWRLLNDLKSEPDPTVRPSPFARLQEGWLRLVLREPTRSRRLLRVIFANWLSAADLPDAERARRVKKGRHGLFYDPPPGAPRPAGLFTPDQRDAWLESTLYLRLIWENLDGFEQAEARESALRAGLVVRLAEELYKREHGKLPDSPDQLVGPYLKMLPEGYVLPEKPAP